MSGRLLQSVIILAVLTGCGTTPAPAFLDRKLVCPAEPPPTPDGQPRTWTSLLHWLH